MEIIGPENQPLTVRHFNPWKLEAIIPGVVRSSAAWLNLWHKRSFFNFSGITMGICYETTLAKQALDFVECLSNYIHMKLWDEITNTCLYSLTDCHLEGWVSNHIAKKFKMCNYSSLYQSPIKILIQGPLYYVTISIWLQISIIWLIEAKRCI